MGFGKWRRSVTRSAKKSIKREGQKFRETAKGVGPEVTAIATVAVSIANPALGAIAGKAQQQWQEGVAQRRYENSLDEQPQLEPYTQEQAAIKRDFIDGKREIERGRQRPPSPKQGSRGTTPGLRSAVFDIPILGDLFAFLFGTR